jgi:hydrogenase maturation factor
MARRGWTSHTFKPGDKIKMTGHAAKDGSKILFLTKVETPDGKII